jgi:hypothetical protein
MVHQPLGCLLVFAVRAQHPLTSIIFIFFLIFNLLTFYLFRLIERGDKKDFIFSGSSERGDKKDFIFSGSSERGDKKDFIFSGSSERGDKKKRFYLFRLI